MAWTLSKAEAGIRLGSQARERQLARQQGKRGAVELYGSLENVARRLPQSLRLLRCPEEAFATGTRRQIRLDSS